MQRMREKHALTMKHTTGVERAKVAAAKAMAAAKPKKPEKGCLILMSGETASRQRMPCN